MININIIMITLLCISGCSSTSELRLAYGIDAPNKPQWRNLMPGVFFNKSTIYVHKYYIDNRECIRYIMFFPRGQAFITTKTNYDIYTDGWSGGYIGQYAIKNNDIFVGFYEYELGSLEYKYFKYIYIIDDDCIIQSNNNEKYYLYRDAEFPLSPPWNINY